LATDAGFGGWRCDWKGVAWVVAERFAGRQASGKSAGAALVQGSAAAPAFHYECGRRVSVFLKVGAVLFGSGYVCLAVLRRIWWAFALADGNQLIDAIAVSQERGPFFTWRRLWVCDCRMERRGLARLDVFA